MSRRKKATAEQIEITPRASCSIDLLDAMVYRNTGMGLSGVVYPSEGGGFVAWLGMERGRGSSAEGAVRARKPPEGESNRHETRIV